MMKNITKLMALAIALSFGAVALAQCPAPTNLAATVNTGNVNLTWTHAQGMENDELINENFDSYTVGTKVRAAAGATNWTTWSNYSASEDAVISNEQSNSGSNSVKFVYGNDVVLKLGNKTTGHYRIGFDMYVPTGKDGYFNVLHEFNGSNSTWAMQVYLHLTNDGQNSTSTPNIGMIHAGSNSTASFTCVYDQWMHFDIDIDIDNNTASFYVDNTFVASWDWNLDSFGENVTTGHLDAMNFFPPEAASTSMYYIDNIVFEQYVGKYNIFRDNVVIASNQEGDSYTDKFVAPGTYAYTVQTACADSVSAMSNSASATIAPYSCNPVQNFTATYNGFSTIDLAWNTPDGASTTGMWYNIYDNANLVYTTSDTVFQYNINIAGQHVIAVEANYGNCLSPQVSQTINVSEVSCGIPSCTVSDTVISGATYMLVRTSVIPSAVAYNVFLYDPTLDMSALYHTLTGNYTGVYGAAEPGETRCYFIQAGCIFDTDTVWSASSDTVCFTYPMECYPPTNIQLQIAGGNNVNIIWQESPNALAYNIYRNDELVGQNVEESYYTDANVDPGVYSYKVTGVCIDGSESEPLNGPTINIIDDGVGENSVKAIMYPNPAQNVLNISANGLKEISIFNMVGQSVYKTKVETDDVTINTSAFESGIYMVVIDTETGSATKRVTIIK